MGVGSSSRTRQDAARRAPSRVASASAAERHFVGVETQDEDLRVAGKPACGVGDWLASPPDDGWIGTGDLASAARNLGWRACAVQLIGQPGRSKAS